MAQKFTVPITVKQLTTAGSDAITVYVDQDTYARLKLEAGGRLTWGPGASAGDVNLYRDAADVLKTDDTFKAAALFVDGIEIDPTGATTDQVLKYDGTKFVPGTGGGGAGATSLDELTDVTAPSPSAGDFLKWNGTAWVNDPIDLATDTTGDYISSITAGSGIFVDFTPGENAGASVSLDASLKDLNDSGVSEPAAGEFLKYNGAVWVNDTIDLGTDTVGDYVSSVTAGTGINVDFSPGEGVGASVSLNATLDDLSNVTVPTPTTNDVLQWDGTAWVNVAASSVGATSLDGLSDVVITAPEEFQTLEYDGTNWVNKHASVVSYVRNAETTTLTTGTVVYLFGSTGDHATVKRADNNSDTTSSKTVGLVGANIAASQNGPVITRGYVDGIDLSVGYNPGDILWLGENGAFTTTKPSAPDHLVFIGVVVRATNNGIVYVATQNGYELDELHNVSASSPSPGDFLKYNGTLWVNDAINLGTDTVGNYVSSVTAGTGISVNFTPSEDAGASVSLNATIDQLNDVTAPSPSSGDFLKWNGSAWVNDAIDLGTDTVGDYVSSVSGGTGISVLFTPGEGVGASVSLDASLDQLNNVTAPTPTSGDFLKWNGSAWVNDVIDLGTDTTGNYMSGVSAGTGISVTHTPGEGSTATIGLNATLDDLSNVTVTGASAGNVLTFDGSIWTAASAGGGGASVTVSTTPPASPSEGDLWFESDTTRTFVYYDSFWVEVGSTGAGATTSDTAPTNPVQGQFWFNSLNGATYVYYGTVWLEVGAVPVNTLLSTIQAKGDLLVGTAAGVVDNLGVGTTDQVLTVDPTTATGLKWADPQGGGGGGLNTSTDGVFITMAIGF